MNKYDSDSDGDGDDVFEIADPERRERIRQMVQASRAHNVLEDDQVTDFVLRMQEKNEQMVNSVRQQQAEQKQTDFDSDDGSELDYNKRPYRKRTPDSFPPGEAYQMDEEGQIPSFDPKGEPPLSYGRLCCVAFALVVGMIATSVLILVFVVIADGEDAPVQHTGFDGMILPFAPSNLKELCSDDSIKSFQGVLNCREPCMKAACCWEKGENGNLPVCWESHPLECAPYETCVNLMSAANSDHTPYTDTTTIITATKVPIAPEGIKSCDPSNINSLSEVLLCEDSCSYGACCWKDDSSIESCSSDANCSGYKPCEILKSAKGNGVATASPGIVSAPSNMAEICAKSSDACQQFCDRAPCCWKIATVTYTGPEGNPMTESVLGSCSHDDHCVDYQPCRDLPSATNPTSREAQIPQVTGLANVCNVSLEGTCRDTCNAAPCCWQVSTSTFTDASGQHVTEAVQGSCSHRSECEGYLPCLKLPEAQSTTVPVTTTPPPQESTDLASICATSLDGTCRDTCHKASCCWKLATTTYMGPQGNAITESVMGSCSHLDECAAYAPCKKLPEATSSHLTDTPAAPSNLAAACATTLEGECRETCEEASCCWKIATLRYQGPMGASVEEHVRGSCSHRQECIGYEVCQKLPEASAEAETSPPMYIPAAPTNLDQVCSPSPDNVDAMELCMENCEAAICCWKMSTSTFTNLQGQTVTESVQGTCSRQPECTGYKPCSVLDDDVFSPHTPAIDPTSVPTPSPSATTSTSPQPGSNEYTEEVIFDVCYNHETQPNGPNLCEEVCQPGACCYMQGEAACASGFDCAKYEPCQKMIQVADAASNQPTELELACANTNDLSDCVRLCAGGTCCFTTDLGKTCDVVSPSTVCSEYTACETIYNRAVNDGSNR